MSSIDDRFLTAIAIMAAAAYGCRVAGLIIGTHIGHSAKWQRFLDILPACAIGAVLGPAFITMTLQQALALCIAASIYLLSGRFVLALLVGTATLMSDAWVTPMLD